MTAPAAGGRQASRDSGAAALAAWWRSGTPRKDADPACGPEGNARLIGVTGTVLLPVLALGFLSGVQYRDQWWPAHAIAGAAVIPLIGLKIAATGWRAGGYYARRRSYRVWGAPPPVERVNGVIIAASTIVVVVTGCVMWAQGTQSSPWSTWHTDGAVVLAVSAALHVLQRLPLARRATVEEASAGRRTRRGAARLAVCALAVVAGAGVGGLAAGMRNPPRPHDFPGRFAPGRTPAPQGQAPVEPPAP